MCFRPAEAMQALNCPECGTLNPGVAKVCRSCGADLEDYKAELQARIDAGEDIGAAKVTPAGAPSAPGAPAAPGAPTAPKAPAAPGVPGQV